MNEYRNIKSRKSSYSRSFFFFERIEVIRWICDIRWKTYSNRVNKIGIEVPLHDSKKIRGPEFFFAIYKIKKHLN